ncbi:MerR family DNA-binding transcriptional regulator [Nocardioides sp. zg-1308]|uniref:DICT sensory domain-containing protein n=1 Tax=Nocardioides TaxID=1839 RepID=UPI001557F500|nr:MULTISPECIES: DICT sensory domain-containing protein [unclassified Nocardioides]NPD06883.1 MerR family DNA-binding transcriptional regulator [Nocardioides sp. zg-1308]WQQ20771.1 DICT sensory domain-containing protein [Nocardioides sp. S-34]
MQPLSRASLTIGELAHRTGVPITTLRSWESRYGFPRPDRAAGGHRRYAESDVDAVLEVLERRRGGLSLHAAVQRVVAEPVSSGSVFADLRRRRPELAPQVLSRATLSSMSRAIEDECCARAAEPLLFGGFQRVAYLEASYDRWRELARTACDTVVFADFTHSTPVRPLTPVEVALPEHAPLNREWLVICDAPDLPACLAAVELPGQDSRAPEGRSFEAIWSVDPQVVRAASRVAASLADAYRPGWRTSGPRHAPVLDDEPTAASGDLRRATQLFDRMLGYLDDARPSGRGRART